MMKNISRVVLLLIVLGLLLSTTGCDGSGNVYVGVSAGPWVGYPSPMSPMGPMGYPYGWGGGTVVVGRPI